MKSRRRVGRRLMVRPQAVAFAGSKHKRPDHVDRAALISMAPSNLSTHRFRIGWKK
jgi:hypothetical protein